MDDKKRKRMRQYFVTEIMAVFKKGLPKDDQEIYGSGISYEEAVDALEHTISEMKKRSLLF